MSFGSKIKLLRKEKNLTIEEISKKSGLCMATISLIENDTHTPNIKSIKKLSEALDIDFETLYREVN